MFGYMSKKDRRIANLKAMVNRRDKKIKILEEDLLIASKINATHQKLNGELQTKLTDLENNIELLINNLSATKKKQLGI